ncbi:hypothetical protein [Kibdelosporangium aridum]|uniref:hypothetical protein n=1 Tax=Kibdelosporangium aridum TaxID=2030 RepID=UPI000F7924AA|nr:hypothetical protein [Kibdelosporangium aridum]
MSYPGADSVAGLASGPSGPARFWARLRAWDGSQQRAFEELCFQLRDPAPDGWRTIKTAAPDGGVEWYDIAPDGRVFGWQAKFVDTVDRLLPQARASLKTVGANRAHRNVVRFTVLAPFDLPDPTPESPQGKPRAGARQRWNDAVQQWQATLPGASDIEIDFRGSGQLLERLTQPGNEGRQWFFFQDVALGPGWCRRQWEQARRVAHDRYTPECHVALPLGDTIDGLALSPAFRQRVTRRAEAVRAALAAVSWSWSRWQAKYDVPAALVKNRQAADAEFHSAMSTAAIIYDTLQNLDALHGLAAASLASHLRELTAALDVFTGHASQLAHLLEAEEPASWPADSADPLRHDPAMDTALWLPTPEAEHPSGPLEAAQALRNIIADYRDVDQVIDSARSLASLLHGRAARAAEAGAWLLLGRPGQGKTHLLLDAAKRALDDGRLAVTVLGEELSGNDPLTEIARRLELGDLPHQTFLQALDAAGAATNARFLLIIDALNDSDQPARWKIELPRLLAQTADYPHVAVVVSCRDTMRDVVLPSDLDRLDLPSTVHPGFNGHEVEALERYLRDVPHALPRTPLLLPAFSNGLFVKLYADGLSKRARRTTTAVPVSSTQHRSAVFESFVDLRAEIICERLKLDPASRPVHRAIQTLAERMAATQRDVLEREDARALVDAYAPGRTEHPNTMLAQLISNGLLTSDRYYVPQQEPLAGVGFTYQAFSDDRIVRAVLQQHRDEADLLSQTGSLSADSPLRRWLTAASPNLTEAASVLIPEMTGFELIDVLDAGNPNVDASGTRREQRKSIRRVTLLRALLITLPLRDASTVTPRTVELVDQALREHSVEGPALDAVLAVATEPGHPLNADRLHDQLVALSRVRRDAWWGPRIYATLSAAGPLHRLLRWAEQLPTPRRLQPDQQAYQPIVRPRRAGMRPPVRLEPAEPPAEVVRLAATTLAWTLTSSNRFLRDRATKALVQLLLGYPDVLSSVLTRFLRHDARSVDDPYLFERLTLVAYGVAARVGWAQPDAIGQLARQILTDVYGDPHAPTHASTNALLCDAAQGVIDIAVRMGVLTPEEAAPACHPHPAPEPGDAPTNEQVDERFPHGSDDPQKSWSSIWFSLRDMGDFAHYEVRHAVHGFTQLPLTQTRPSHRHAHRSRSCIVIADRIPAFRVSLPETVQATLGTAEAVTRLLEKDWLARRILDEDQYHLLRACEKPPPADERLFDADQDEEGAARWVFARVAALGWTPELFGEFDRRHGHGYGSRETHKAERIGKKYQWMALHELVERLANHYYPNGRFIGGSSVYIGAWQAGLRDIDPTLPPASHPLDTEEDDSTDNETRFPTFPTDPGGFWTPSPPSLPDRDTVKEWIATGPAPTLSQTAAAVRTDEHNTPWVVLGEYAKDTAEGRGWADAAGQAEQWHIISSWLVPHQQLPDVVEFLSPRSLIPTWMPDERNPHQLYLAEFPDAPAVSDLEEDLPDSSHELTFIDHDTAQKHSMAKRRALRTARSKPATDGEPQATIEGFLRRLTGPTTLEELAARWADTANMDDDDLDDLFSDTDSDGSHIHRGVDHSGKRLHAFPATQQYSWSGSSADCSIDTNVGVQLPANKLIAGTDLIRHPDRPDWYDTTGRHTISYRWTHRPTGTVQTLLIRQDWLDQRLHDLGYALILGLFGERQQVTRDPELWGTYSQIASRTPDQPWNFSAPIETIRQSQR